MTDATNPQKNHIPDTIPEDPTAVIVAESNLIPNLALTFASIPAGWWFVTLLSFMTVDGSGNGSVLDIWGYLGVPCLMLWIAALVFAHIGFHHRTRYNQSNRSKLIGALIIAYVQVPLILAAVGMLILGVLFLGVIFTGMSNITG